jgi:hypothetical protein
MKERAKHERRATLNGWGWAVGLGGGVGRWGWEGGSVGGERQSFGSEIVARTTSGLPSPFPRH